jgi:glycosyltransferase involved in cell wall biosynthesis
MASAANPVIVYFSGSFTSRSNGAHVRTDGLVRWLATRFKKVVLYSFAEHPEEPWTDAARAEFAARYPDVELIIDPASPRHALTIRAKAVAHTVAPTLGRRIFARGAKGAGFQRLAGTHPQAVFIANYVDAVAQVPGLPLERTIIDTHDLKFIKRAKRRGESVVSLRGLTRFRSEIGMLDLVAGNIGITLAETQFLRSVIADRPVHYVPTYESVAGQALPPAGPDAADFLFVGSANDPNIAGFCAFVDENRDWLSAYRLSVCGRICSVPAVRERLAGLPRAKVLGFVEDLADVYREARACLSPVDGTGLKIKVLEALSYGRPVFASRHSMDGLPSGYGRAVFPIDRERMEAFVADPQAVARGAEAAARYYATFSELSEADALREHLIGLGATPKD